MAPPFICGSLTLVASGASGGDFSPLFPVKLISIAIVQRVRASAAPKCHRKVYSRDCYLHSGLLSNPPIPNTSDFGRRTPASSTGDRKSGTVCEGTVCTIGRIVTTQQKLRSLKICKCRLLANEPWSALAEKGVMELSRRKEPLITGGGKTDEKSTHKDTRTFTDGKKAGSFVPVFDCDLVAAAWTPTRTNSVSNPTSSSSVPGPWRSLSDQKIHRRMRMKSHERQRPAVVCAVHVTSLFYKMDISSFRDKTDAIV
ncbi:hypothetical protein ZHAS_00003430 [Anopheles sinensis]|uniref:Uncharacterized protein n=1 Tax=Anopheles sinensis TaxID=74873 RepID=A0A084VEA5_ANOSI|nr:hypothetical protein ZHAS_00003430 [Anopheles sinensis]